MNHLWKYHFVDDIQETGGDTLEKGFALYANGRVTQLTQSGNVFQAAVDGCLVELTLADGSPSSMTCTCPQARNGENCAHMAAVLYATDQPKETWEKDLHRMVRYLFEQEYRIDHGEAYDLMDDMASCLQHALLPLIQNGEIRPAMELVGQAYEVGMVFWWDPDIDPDYSILVEYCETLWRKMFDLVTPAQREEMRLWFWEYYHNWHWDAGTLIAEFILSFAWDERQQAENRKHLLN